MLLGLFVLLPGALLAQHSFKYDTTLYNKMQWREIGPFRAGRSIAVAGHKDQPLTFYFGATGGGIWKNSSAVSSRSATRGGGAGSGLGDGGGPA